MIDEGFIQRTYRTTVVVWMIATLTCLAYRLWFGAIGFTVGTLVSIGVLASLEHVVRRVFVPGATDATKALAKFGILKFIALAAIITGVVLTHRTDVIVGFAAGAALTQLIMFLKAVGASIVERTGQ